MRGIDIGREARSGKYCDICKQMVYIDIWGHIVAHKKDLQRKEDACASREHSQEFMERLRCRASFGAYKAGRARPVQEFMDDLE